MALSLRPRARAPTRARARNRIDHEPEHEATSHNGCRTIQLAAPGSSLAGSPLQRARVEAKLAFGGRGSGAIQRPVDPGAASVVSPEDGRDDLQSAERVAGGRAV